MQLSLGAVSFFCAFFRETRERERRARHREAVVFLMGERTHIAVRQILSHVVRGRMMTRAFFLMLWRTYIESPYVSGYLRRFPS